MTAEEKLYKNVENIVDGVIQKIPKFLQRFAEPHKKKLIKAIVDTSSEYVNQKIRNNNYNDCY